LSLCEDITSSVLLPIEPVDPSIVTLFILL
jgi:hypothetical protein